MRIEQGVKVVSASTSKTEDLKEKEIIIVEYFDDMEEVFVINQIFNGESIPIVLKALRKDMIPNIENPNLYCDFICECYELETALKIAKLLNGDLKRGDV